MWLQVCVVFIEMKCVPIQQTYFNLFFSTSIWWKKTGYFISNKARNVSTKFLVYIKKNPILTLKLYEFFKMNKLNQIKKNGKNLIILMEKKAKNKIILFLVHHFCINKKKKLRKIKRLKITEMRDSNEAPHTCLIRLKKFVVFLFICMWWWNDILF